MDDKAVRNWSLGLGGGALAIATLLANTGDKTPADQVAASAKPGAPAAVEFIVRFKPGHPMAAAQDLSAAGKSVEAEAAAREALQHAAALKGLCWEGFTMGGVETVLSICADPPPGKRAAASLQWSEKLRKLDGVEYADANVVVAPEAH